MTNPEEKVFADYRVVEFIKKEDKDRTIAQKLAELIGEIDLDYVEPAWNTMEVIFTEHDAVSKPMIAIKFKGREKDGHQKEDGADHPEGK